MNLTRNVIRFNSINVGDRSGKRIWFEDLDTSGAFYNKSTLDIYFTDYNNGKTDKDESDRTGSLYEKFATLKSPFTIPESAKYLYVVSHAFFDKSKSKYQISYSLGNVMFGGINTSNKLEHITYNEFVELNGVFNNGIKVLSNIATDLNFPNNQFDLGLIETIYDLDYFRANYTFDKIWLCYPKNEVTGFTNNAILEKPIAYFVCEENNS